MSRLAPHPPLTEYYDAPERREAYVREIFDETAPWYDWATWFLSFGSGDWYRRSALQRADVSSSTRVLDIAAGTGVVTRAALSLSARVVGLDASLGMLLSNSTPSPKAQCVAESLAVRSQTFDRVTIGFALRHFADLTTVFRECHRVLKPGGRLLILEITAPESRLARAALGVYMGRFAPAVIGLRTRNRRAAELFRYYWETTRDCVRPQVILDALADAGFEDVQRRIELGIFSEYSATRSE